jgi:hypothetical protein
MIATEVTAILLFLIGAAVGMTVWQMVAVALVAAGLTVTALITRYLSR